MSTPSSIDHLEAILEPLLALGLIREPEEVRETYTRGYREQVIGDTHFSATANADYWRVQVERASENVIRGAQAFVSALAVQRHLAKQPSRSQVVRQVDELEQKLSSMTALERESIIGAKLQHHATRLAGQAALIPPAPSEEH